MFLPKHHVSLQSQGKIREDFHFLVGWKEINREALNQSECLLWLLDDNNLETVEEDEAGQEAGHGRPSL